MALDWNLVKNKGVYKKHHSAVTDAIIFNCQIIGMGKITEKNAQEFHTRCLFFSRISDTMSLISTFDGVERNFTLQEIKDHIGLETNVTHVSMPTWLRDISRQYWAELQRQTIREAK